MSDITPIGWISDDCSALLESKHEGRGYIYPNASPDHDNAVYLDVDVNQQRAEVDRLRAEVATLRSVLQSVQWGGECGAAFGVMMCPVCGSGSDTHDYDCEIAAALAAIKGTDHE